MNVADLFAAYLRHAEVEGLHAPAALQDRRRVFGLFVAWLERLEPRAVAGAHEALAPPAPVGTAPVPAGAYFRVAGLRPYHLRDFIEAHPEWRSPSTRYSKAGFIRAAFAWAAEDGRIDRNPFAQVRYRQAEPRPPMPDDVFEALCNAASKPVERILRFLRYTGRRLSEAANARWEDVDLDRGLWRIERHKTRKKTGRAQLVALVPEAVALLHGAAMAGTAALPQEAAVVSPHLAGEGLKGVIFLNSRGRPWNRQQLGKRVRELKERLGIQHPATTHGLRHAWASAAIDAGAPIKAVAEQLGHSSVRTTEAIYFHASERTLESMRQAACLAMPHS